MNNALSWLRARFTNIAEKRVPGLSLVANWLANAVWLINTTWRSLIREAYGRNAVVYAALRLLCQSIAEARLKAYTEDKDGNQEELPRDHELVKLLHHPNELMTEFEFIELTTIQVAAVGVSVWWKERSNAGKPIALWPLRPDRVGPIYAPKDSDEGFKVLLGYSYQDPSTGNYVPIPRRDCLAFNLPDPDGETGGIVEGFGPIAAISREVAADNKATEHVGALLANYAQPGIVLEIMDSVDEDQAKVIKAKFRQEFGGTRLGTPAILDAGAKITPLGFNLEQLEFPDLRDNAEARICAVIGVPASLVGVKAGLNPTYSNAREAREFFAETTCSMYWRRYGDQLTSDLASEFDENAIIEFDTSKVRALAGQQVEKLAPIKDGFSSGVVTVDEYRQALNLDPLPDGLGGVVRYPSTVTEVPVTPEAIANAQKKQAETKAAEQAANGSKDSENDEQDATVATDEPSATGGERSASPGAEKAWGAVGSDRPLSPESCNCHGAATKLNPYHDSRGRFSSGTGAGDPKALAAGLVSNAAAAEPAVTAAVQSAAQIAGGEMKGLEFRLKSEPSLARKIDSEYKENRQVSMEQAAGNITDVLRYTMVLPTANYSRGVDVALQSLKEQGMEPHDHKFRNYWGGTEYQGLNTVMKTKSGQRFELQFHTKESLATKENNHPLYEQQRTSKSKTLKQQLSNQMTRAWQNVTTPTGVAALTGAAYGWGG